MRGVYDDAYAHICSSMYDGSRQCIPKAHILTTSFPLYNATNRTRRTCDETPRSQRYSTRPRCHCSDSVSIAMSCSLSAEGQYVLRYILFPPALIHFLVERATTDQSQAIGTCQDNVRNCGYLESRTVHPRSNRPQPGPTRSHGMPVAETYGEEAVSQHASAKSASRHPLRCPAGSLYLMTRPMSRFNYLQFSTAI